LVERIHRPDVHIEESYVGGLEFLDLLTGYDKAIIIDAVQSGNSQPGEIHRFELGSFQTTRHVNNPHDLDFTAALELGKALNIELPRDVVIFGIEIKEVTTMSEECTPEVAQAIPACVNLVLNELPPETPDA
jgi:hydrogenase maturation protease